MEIECMSNVAGTHLLSFFALFMVAGVLMRCAIGSSTVSKGTFKCYLEDIVAAFEVYGCNIGHIYIFQMYRFATYLTVVIIVGIYHGLVLKGCSANPITHVLRYLTGCCPPDVTIKKILAQVCGGLVGHVTVSVFWPFLISDFDSEMLEEMRCVAASTLVPVIICLVAEFLGTVVICFLVFNVASSSVDFFEPPIKVLLTCLLSATGVFVSNTYLNPVVASSRLIGSGGKDFFLHLITYWTAPIGGAAIAVLYKEYTSHESDLACLPPRKCQKVFAGLKSDFDSDQPCIHNVFRQPARPSTPVLEVQMPPIYVSRAEEVEDDNGDDEVIYTSAKDSDVARVNEMNYHGQAHRSQRPRQYTQRPFEDTCFREFPGSNTTAPLDTVTLSKTCTTHCVAPISRHINRLLNEDLCPFSDQTVADNCCGYREPLSCSSPLPAQSGCNNPGGQSYTIGGVPYLVSPCPGTDTKGFSHTDADDHITAPPTRKRSEHAIITQSPKDNSQNQGSGNTATHESAQQLHKPALYDTSRLQVPETTSDRFRPATYQFPKSQSHPVPNSHPTPPHNDPHKSTLMGSTGPHTTSHQGPTNTRPPPSQNGPLKSTPQGSTDIHATSHLGSTDVHRTPSHKDPHKPSHQSSTDNHTTASHQGTTHTHPALLHSGPHIPTPQGSTATNTKPSHQVPTDKHLTPPHNDPLKSTPQGSTHTTSHHGPTNPHSMPLPSHKDPRKS